MMLRRTVSFAMASLLLAVAAPAKAQIVIGDFEGGSLNGWVATGGTLIYADDSPGYGGEFASQGTSWSLNLLAPDLTAGPPAGTFRWSMQLANYAAGAPANLGALLAANPILEADVGWRLDEWTPSNGNWARWDTASINSDVGWRQTNDSHMSDSANPGFPGSWDVSNWGAIHKRTVRWDFRGAMTPAERASLATSSFIQLNLSTNYDGAFTTAGGSFWIDQIRLIPEPSSVALAAVIDVLPVVRRRFGRR